MDPPFSPHVATVPPNCVGHSVERSVDHLPAKGVRKAGLQRNGAPYWPKLRGKWGPRVETSGGRVLVATSAHHIVRVTVRVSVAAFHRDIDVTLPTSSTFAEVLPELARLVELPQIHRPWEISTAGGRPLDMHTPLYALKLHDGAVIALRPKEPIAPPVVRDAADALAHAGRNARSVRGLDTAATLVGLACIALLLSMFAPSPATFAVTGLCALTLAAVAKSPAVFAAAPLCLGWAAATWVIGGTEPNLHSTDVALGALAGVVTAFITVGIGVALRLAGPALVAFAVTVGVLSGIGMLGTWLPAANAPAALSVLTGLFTVAATPGIATRAAGLAVAHVPTAGEEFDRADEYQPDVDARSRVATTIASAVTAGISTVSIPALLQIGSSGGAWNFVFCTCIAGALVVYASRHHWAATRIALMAIALAAVIASAISIVRIDDPHPALITIAVLTALAATTTVLWARRVPDLEPTTVVWFERAEIAALIAVIPLAVHLTGVFDLIRGL